MPDVRHVRLKLGRDTVGDINAALPEGPQTMGIMVYLFLIMAGAGFISSTIEPSYQEACCQWLSGSRGLGFTFVRGFRIRSWALWVKP